jgi:hypothetical protein
MFDDMDYIFNNIDNIHKKRGDEFNKLALDRLRLEIVWL